MKCIAKVGMRPLKNFFTLIEKNNKITYRETFTKEVYYALVSNLKDYERKLKVNNDIFNKFEDLLAIYVDNQEDYEYTKLLIIEWEAQKMKAFGYKEHIKNVGKLLKNIKQTRNRMYSIIKVIVNIYNLDKKTSFKEKKESFEKMMSEYFLLDNGKLFKKELKV